MTTVFLDSQETCPMSAVRIRTRIDSETLHLPELKPLIGRTVEILIAEIPPATREEVYAEAAHVPQTPEEQAAQQQKFRAWRSDPRFERFWPQLDRWLVDAPAHAVDDSVATRKDDAP